MFEKVEQAKQEWEATLDALPQLVCLVDREGRVLRANRTLERWKLGRVTEVKGWNLHALLHPGQSCINCAVNHFLESALSTHAFTAMEYNDPILERYLLIRTQPVESREYVTPGTLAVIVEDISQQKAAEEALRQYSTMLEAQNEELDAFAHTVAHDLKSPLAVVASMADLLLEEVALDVPAQIRQDLEYIAQASHKSAQIVQELLLLASVRKQSIQVEPLDMAAIVAEAQKRLGTMVKEKAATILLPDTWPIALGYAPWIEEVWINYLSNGMKYGGTPPHLELNAALQSDGMVCFSVTDNGPGIPVDQQARLFTPFTRLHQVRAQGHGLGLSIVKRILDRLNGGVGVQNCDGQGCCFYFTLPGAAHSA
jgi:two-component system, sensor histidine kinase and response regulator